MRRTEYKLMLVTYGSRYGLKEIYTDKEELQKRIDYIRNNRKEFKRFQDVYAWEVQYKKNGEVYDWNTITSIALD